METINRYFKELSSEQQRQFEALMPIYSEWNSKINLISRKDFEHFYQKHVLHSLAIAKVINFKAGTEILDLGTGGGFPGIPLAILFPNVHFTLVDSIGKKIKVVQDVVDQLKLKNVTAINIRGEQLNSSFDFIISRAVTDLPTFLGWVSYKIRKKGINDLKNGILYLKGGDLAEELAQTNKKSKLFSVSDFFDDPFFETKYVVYIS
jgi:16S rRNA (guanine527-N7)-methyltransferase